MKVAIQLYSLRYEIERDGLESVLKEVARAGFDSVELAGTYGLSNTQLKELFNRYGLTVCSAHIDLELILHDFDNVKSLARELGFNKIVLPYIEPKYFIEHFDEFVAKVKDAQKIVAHDGFVLLYHNHDFEFTNDDGLTRFANAVPELLLEIDTFWLKVSGYDCKEYLKAHSNRIGLLHIKELSENGTNDFNPVVGSGIVGAAEILEFAKNNKMDNIILEAEKLNIPYAEYIAKCSSYIKAILNT